MYWSNTLKLPESFKSGTATSQQKKKKIGDTFKRQLTIVQRGIVIHKTHSTDWRNDYERIWCAAITVHVYSLQERRLINVCIYY